MGVKVEVALKARDHWEAPLPGSVGATSPFINNFAQIRQEMETIYIIILGILAVFLFGPVSKTKPTKSRLILLLSAVFALPRRFVTAGHRR